MVKKDCFYYIVVNNEPQCRDHVQGFCPCDTCNQFISKEEMRRQIDIMRKVRAKVNV